MVKKKKNLLKISIVLIVIVVVGLLIFLRPEKNYQKKVSKDIVIRKTVIDEMGDLSKLKPIETGEKKRSKETAKSKKEISTDSQGNKAKTPSPSGEENAVGYLNQHKDSAVRAVDKIDVNLSDPSKYPVVEANFSKVHPLNFRGLKKVYTYYRLKDRFPEVVLKSLNGAVVTMKGAIMPVEKIPEDGVFPAFWLSNPVIVLAGCVFCNPPTLADIIYVSKKSGQIPFSIEREKLFKQVVLIEVTGRLFFGPESTGDQTYLFSIEAETIKVLN